MSFNRPKCFSIDTRFFHCVLLGLILFGYVSGENVKENAIDNESEEQVAKINYRLPNNTKPESYDITLITSIDQNDLSFSGRVIINLVVLEPSYNITIHARKLNIKAINLAEASGAVNRLHPFTYDNVTEFLVIPSQTELQKDTKYALTIEYSGELTSNKCDGFYASHYINSKGELKKVF